MVTEEHRWTMYFDGALNIYRSGIGAIMISTDGQYYPAASKVIFPCTNNIVEYKTCILCLMSALDLRVKLLDVYGD